MFITAFELAAPEMFAAETFAFAPEALYGGMEFGTPALFEGLGAEALGAGAGLFGEFGGSLAGQALGGAPSIGEAVTSGITSGGAGAGGAGINEALVAQQQANAAAAANSGITQAANSGFSQAELEAMQRGQEIAQASSAAPPLEQTAGYGLKGSMMNAPATTGGAYELTGAGPSPNIGEAGIKLGSQTMPAGGVNMGGAGGVSGTFPTVSSTQSGFMKGVGDVLDWADKNPFKAGIGAYMGAQKLGLFDQKKQQVGEDSYKGGILQNYKMSPDFKGRFANPQDFQYTPKVYNMAEGGIASYRAGGDTLSDRLSYFESLRQGQTSSPPSGKTAPHGDHGDVGIYYDLDPDTRYQDALTAAQIRQAKVNKRANMQTPGMKRPIPMGQLNLAPPGIKAAAAAQSIDPETYAAHGGIMRAQRYADGGITGGGNLDLHIPLDLGGGGGGYGGGGGGGGNGGATYPFQNSGGFTGNNNAPQAQPQYNNPSQPQAGNQPSLGLGQFQNGMRSNTTFMDDFSPKGTNAFGGGSEQALSQLFGLLGGQQQQSTGGPNSQNHFASGGMTSLGGYAAGGNPRLLRGPGDGMSDNIPATIAGKQPARLADGEFVIPADVVSHLGNGSTDAGAKILHEMMNKVRQARTGNSKQGKQINAHKFVPA